MGGIRWAENRPATLSVSLVSQQPPDATQPYGLLTTLIRLLLVGLDPLPCILRRSHRQDKRIPARHLEFNCLDLGLGHEHGKAVVRHVGRTDLWHLARNPAKKTLLSDRGRIKPHLG